MSPSGLPESPACSTLCIALAAGLGGGALLLTIIIIIVVCAKRRNKKQAPSVTTSTTNDTLRKGPRCRDTIDMDADSNHDPSYQRPSKAPANTGFHAEHYDDLEDYQEWDQDTNTELGATSVYANGREMM